MRHALYIPLTLGALGLASRGQVHAGHGANSPATDTARGRFRAAEAGRYEFSCSVPGHRAGGMEGVVVVE